MNQYLVDTKFAAQNLIETYTIEFHEINRVNFIRMEALAEATNPSNMRIAVEQFQAIKQTTDTIHQIQKEFDAKEFALKALCAAILQIAKQGISITHKGLSNCPDGRLIGTQPIKNVIWHGRNQAMHFEEGNPYPPVVKFFEQVDADFKTNNLPNIKSENMALQVVSMLNWVTYANYEADMKSLLP